MQKWCGEEQRWEPASGWYLFCSQRKLELETWGPAPRTSTQIEYTLSPSNWGHRHFRQKWAELCFRVRRKSAVIQDRCQASELGDWECRDQSVVSDRKRSQEWCWDIVQVLHECWCHLRKAAPRVREVIKRYAAMPYWALRFKMSLCLISECLICALYPIHPITIYVKMSWVKRNHKWEGHRTSCYGDGLVRKGLVGPTDQKLARTGAFSPPGWETGPSCSH